MVNEIGKYSICVDLAVGVGEVFTGALDSGWVYANTPAMEELRHAYDLQYPNLASQVSLDQQIDRLVVEGPEHVDGFVSGLKGKLAELRAEDVLEKHFSGYDFHLAANPTQPVWDLVGIDGHGHEIVVQIKMRGAEAASDVAAAAADAHDVYFGVSHELFTQLADKHPELVGHLIDLGSNEEIARSTADTLHAIAIEHGVPVDHSVAEILPYVGEIVLGLRLLYEIYSTNRKCG